jgi:DnaJ-class molecular chaperone
MSELETVARTLRDAGTYLDVFGSDAREKDIKSIYRRLARVVHEDRYQDSLDRERNGERQDEASLARGGQSHCVW